MLSNVQRNMEGIASVTLLGVYIRPGIDKCLDFIKAIYVPDGINQYLIQIVLRPAVSMDMCHFLSPLI